jgi:DNA-directed RNA polymerase specialized sigma24 family protein
MTANALSEHVITDSFEEVEKLIYYTIHLFVKKYGGRFEDQIEHAGLAFMIAWRKYDPTAGMTFASYVRYVLFNLLLDIKRKETRRCTKLIFEAVNLDTLSILPDFKKSRFLDELSNDAHKVVQLVLATPPGLQREIAAVKTPRTIKWILRRHLRTLGWTADRISESFNEIRRAL